MRRILLIAAVVAIVAGGLWASSTLTAQISAEGHHNFTAMQCQRCGAWMEITGSVDATINDKPATVRAYACKNGHHWKLWLEPGD